MCKPAESRKRLLSIIRNAESPLPIKQVREIEYKEKLWFGPGIDAIDFLFAKEALGVIRIDLKNDLVVATR